jgi:hypothetical protein
MARLNSTIDMNNLPIDNFQLDHVSFKNIPTFFDKAKTNGFMKGMTVQKGYDIIYALIIVY